MMSWSQRMAEAQRRPMPIANSADSANRSDAEAIGAIGTIGTGLPSWAPQPAGKLSALLAPGLSALPPCPSDVAERAAIIAEGDHCDRATADARALAEHGLPSWPALADLHRERILAELVRLPPASSDHGRRLLEISRAFLDSDHWQAAVALGWDLVEVFGLCPVAPLTRLDRQGLVPGIALSRLLGPRIVALEPGFAMIETRTGSRLRHEAGRLGPEAEHWWRCPAIIGETT